MVTCPRFGCDADYLPGDLFSLVNCDVCADTIDVTELAEWDDAERTVRRLAAVAGPSPSPRVRQVA